MSAATPLIDRPSVNAVTFFDDGEALFREKAAAIAAARERVWVETFMLAQDRTGREAVGLLADAARRGCDVVLLFDQVGSHVTNLGIFAPVEKAGGRVGIFNPLPQWRRWGRRTGPYITYRDHRKVMVVDDVGFCGGHNFSQAYMGPPPHDYYDMSVKLAGPCVADLAGVFNDSLRKATGETRPPPSPPPVPHGVQVEVRGQDARAGQHGTATAWRELLDAARERAIVVMAYFAPDEQICAPLVRAAERGVDVQFLTIGATDIPFVRWAGETAYDRLLGAGVRIFRLREPKLHAKAVAVDDVLCMVGSYDASTFERRNTAEVAVLARDPQLAAAIRGGFQRSLPRCEEITPAAWRRRSPLRRLAGTLSLRVLRV